MIAYNDDNGAVAATCCLHHNICTHTQARVTALSWHTLVICNQLKMTREMKHWHPAREQNQKQQSNLATHQPNQPTNQQPGSGGATVGNKNNGRTSQ